MSRLKSLLFILAGGISICLSIWCFSMSGGGYTSYEKYGGDFYTGSQQATADAANNVSDLYDLTKIGFGSVLLVAGLTLVIVGIPDEEKEASAPAGQQTPAAQPRFTNNDLPEL